MKIKLTNNKKLKDTGAQYVTVGYQFGNEDPDKVTFELSKDSEEFVITMKVDNIDAFMKKEFTSKDLQIKLKKKVAIFYSKEMDTAKLSLAGLGNKSVMEKRVNLDNATIDVQLTIHKAPKASEVERVQVIKKRVKLIPAPFKTLEEQTSGVARKKEAPQ